MRPGEAGVWVNQRLVAGVGVAVRDWVSYYGMWINICPDLDLFRRIRNGRVDMPMTSIARERRGAPQLPLVRQRLIEHFADRFGFGRTALFFDHPMLAKRAESQEKRVEMS